MSIESNNYTAKSLNVLEGLDPVRVHPGMYTDTTCPNHLAQEAIDNSVDEALAGHANSIKVTILTNNTIRIEDNGRGMPVDIHPEYKLSGIELILTKLHAGGKFNKENYTFSGGLHGVGISVVNALATQLTVQVKRNGNLYQIAFADGKKTQELKIIDTIGKKNTGTIVEFSPDPQFFDQAAFDLKKLKHLLQAKAVLCPNLTINYYDSIKEESITWHYANGMQEYFTEQLSESEYTPQPVWSVVNEAAEFGSQWAIAWHPEPTPTINESYVNLVPTQYGGTHVVALKNGANTAIKQFCEIHDLLPKNLKIKADDVLTNCSYILSVKMLNPQFFGQTKDRLTAKSIVPYLSKTVEDHLLVWLNQNMSAAHEIIDIIIANAQKRLRQAKKVVRKKINSGPALPGKLTDCSNPFDLDSELFLVEGDSAGGSARQARDKEYQAVLPLRGKILNTWEVSVDQVLASQTVNDIAIAIGVEPNSTDISQCRYGKICILADADSDGNHISTLLCALFYRHFQALIVANKIFVAMPPLYRIDIGKKVVYALDDSEKNAIIENLSVTDQNRSTVQRFKGLGEMNPSQLRETTMAVDTRRLVQLTISCEEEENMMDLLLAKKRSEDRRNWLESTGHLSSNNEI